MSRKAWLLSSGEYSDYGVLAVFSTREEAEAVAARHTGVFVEECELDPGILRRREGLYWWQVEIELESGTVRQALELFPKPDELATKVEPYQGYTWDYVPGKRSEMIPKPPALRVQCWARDSDHAVKIAADKRAEHLAAGA